MINKKVFSIIFIFFLLITLCSCSNNKPKEKIIKLKDESSGIIINGDYLIYLNLQDEYKELEAIAYDGNKDVSENISITYYKDGRQFFDIDTSSPGIYNVKYQVKIKNKLKEASRVVIISDVKAPKFNNVDTVTITDLDAATYDVKTGVTATDNASSVNITCDNSLKNVKGNYAIKCTAKDKYGNTSTIKRLIKVIDSIKFNYNDNKLIIDFPKNSSYTYKYSIDGGKTFIDCQNSKTLDINKGSVIATVWKENELITSNTYYIN